MKRLLIPIIASLLASQAWSAQQNISTITTKSTREALRTAVNAEFDKVQSNTTELYSLAIAAPWLAQTTAPSIHNVFWVDTSGTSPVIKYWDGDSWEVAAAGDGGTYTLPAASVETLGGVKQGAGTSIAADGTISVTAAGLSLGTSDNPSFASVHASGGNLAAANAQVTKKWITGLPYTANLTSVIYGGKHYICTSTHTAGSTTEPGVGASWATVWSEVSGAGDNLGSASYSDVVGLWTACTGYLKSDGTCSTPSGTFDEGTAYTWTAAQDFIAGISADGIALDVLSWADFTYNGVQVVNASGTGVNELLPASSIVALLGGKADSSHTHTGYEAADASIVKQAEIDTQIKFEALTGWTLPTGGSGDGFTFVSDWPSSPADNTSYYNTATDTIRVYTSTGYTTFSGTTSAYDVTPSAFSFTDETDIAINTSKTSNAITVASIDHPVAISVSGSTGYGYSKNSAACTGTSGTAVVGDTVAACVTSSAANSTETTAQVTIGGVSDTYSVTTVGGGETVLDEQTAQNTTYRTLAGLAASDNCQRIQHSGTHTITKVRLWMYKTIDTENTYAQASLWTTNDRGTGTQIGGYSDAMLISGTSVPATYTEFAWTSNSPQPTGDYYLHINKSSGANELRLRTAPNTTPTAYVDTDYDYATNQTDLDTDAVFQVLGY